MRCLITGASGFIGSHLTKFLFEKDCILACIIPPGEDLWRIREFLPSLRIIESDLAGVKNIHQKIKEFNPQVVIHAGWFGVDKDQRNQFEQINQNLYGSLDLLSACLESECDLFIGIGSQAEYGPTDQVLTEEMAVRPDTMYGVVKLSTGLLAQRICATSNMRFVWLRLTAAYGPKDNPSHLIPYVISTLLRKEEPALTHGNQQWDYLYVEDIAAAIWSVIEHPAAEGIFNLSTGQSTSVRKVCEIIRDQIDPKLPLGFSKLDSPGKSRAILEARNDRLHQATGWSPKIPLVAGLKKTIDWYKQ